MKLRPYQDSFVSDLSVKLAQGKRKLVAQLPTGAGKTIVFSAICDRYLKKNPGKRVLILVHRKELLTQTRKTIYKAYGIAAQPVIAGMKVIPPASVYVGMVESSHRRQAALQNIGLVIIDEAHRLEFIKLHAHFPEQFIIGFTATPLTASKRKPLKMFYEDIVCGIEIPELITQGSLCQNITFAPKDSVERAGLSIKNGEFEDGLMALQFSKPKYVSNCVKAYEKNGKGSKTIVFNVTIQHSIKVQQAFYAAGYNCRHLDGTASATERTRTLEWFATTPDAILCNVGIATTGFDQPDIETVIVNKATMSMPLWLQMTGRGSRPTEAKSAFTIIDMGSNVTTHGDWNQSRNWEDIFFNPPKANDDPGIAPVKDCPQCEAILPAGARTCKFCGYEFPAREQEQEVELSELIAVTRGINVAGVIEANRHRKEYYPFFKIGKDLAIAAKKTVPRMTSENADFILTHYHSLASEWCSAVGKKFNHWHKERAKEHLFTELEANFKNWKRTA